MRKMERDVRRGVAAAVVLLLLGFLGCTKTLERAPRATALEKNAPVTPASAVTHEASTVTDPATTLSDQAAGAQGESAPPATEGLAADAPGDELYLRLHELSLAERDGQQALVASLSRVPDDVRHFTLGAPDRLVIDLEGPVPAIAPSRTYPATSREITRVRTGIYGGNLRLVADLSSAPADVAVALDGRVVTALLGAGTIATQETLYLAPGISPAAAASIASSAPASDAGTPAAGELAGATSAPASIVPATYEPMETPMGSEPATPALGEAAADEGAAPPTKVETAASIAAATASNAETIAAATRVDAAEPLPDVSVPMSPSASPALDSDPPPLDLPEAYALPVLAADTKTKSKTTVTKIDGGTIETTEAPVSARQPKAYSGERISLDFKDADIQNVLRIIADVSGMNIITTEDVSGKLTMRLVDVPWDQALDAILNAKGLDMVREGNIIRVSTVEQLKKEREAQRAADEAQKQVEPLLVKYIRVNYAKADEKLKKKVEEVLTDRGSATWDERTNTIVIRDIARGVAFAQELITNFDTQTPQVLIEANIVEATDALIRDLGIQWGYTYRASPETGNAPGVNFPGRIGAGGILAGGTNSPVGPGGVPFIADFPANISPGAGAAYDVLLGSLDGSNSLSARLTALENERKGKIISRPRVVTLNNVPAKIESLRILRVRLPSTGTVISSGAGGVAGTAQAATEQIRTGITLNVTPQVSADGFIFLDVFAKSSTLIASSSPDNIPDEISREAESHVLIRDGDTFVLGGVFRNELSQSDRGVPYLRSIPVLGWAFRNNLNDDSRQELLVFITPRAVAGRGTESVASLPSAEDLWQNRDTR